YVCVRATERDCTFSTGEAVHTDGGDHAQNYTNGTQTDQQHPALLMIWRRTRGLGNGPRESTHAHTHTHTHTHKHTQTHTNTNKHTHTQTHRHTDTHRHTHT